ncbi:MAG: CBS domain-containing protein, partial [Bradymonadaceae bacterium]
MEVQELAQQNVVTVTEEVSLIDAVSEMYTNHVGNLVVVEADNSSRKPVGIITDRDLVMA